MERLGIPSSKRNVVKKPILAAIFFDYNRLKESRYIKVMRKEFPAIANYIHKTKRNHTLLASLLQKSESKFVIEKVVQEFINRFGEGYEFISTIHDSIVVKENMLEEAEKVMNYCFNKESIYPKLSTNIYKSPPNTT